ncbi:disease resistance protein RPV1-like [Argentina anserina]|uniref:disease resistance protein RPV1-like n=1 Tax=Argentina anserina TaxID=57926 RepID=UPI0021765881|nr:disease resistance protein RPV1-like [Potentilla anserina]
MLEVTNMAAASSSSTSVARVLPQQKYDVFLSFRGEDTRLKFVSHLYAALERKKIYTYMDDKSLERGDELGPALLTAIEQSKLSIITFSEHYASSAWCLDELVHIMKCNQDHGQLVIPVFYDIDPSHVRWQEGTYADAFAVLEERFKDNMDKVHTWRDALTRGANLSGFHSQSQDMRNENALVEKIVKDIWMKLMNGKLSYFAKGLVGMKKHIQQLEMLLCIPAQDICIRTVGIWGMGGCGKTTLADAVFHRNSSEFHACVFLANVREQSEKHGLNHLRNELFRKLLQEEHLCIDSPSIGSSYIIDRLSRTKVLAVLDDVSDLSQLDILLGDQVQFGPGSRIIITTRNRRLLKKRVHEDHIYKVNLLSNHEALQLFQSIAFEDDSSKQGYSKLSEEVVDYAGGIPLALKVLASSFLHCNSKIVWEDEFKKMKTFPNQNIQNVLRLSYNGLEENEKGIFLDIACFLKGENISDAKRVLELRGFFPSSGIGILIDMSLISIRHDRVEMHDLLQEMGRAIEEGGIVELGKRKRVWNAKDAYQILRHKSGISTVEAMYLDMSKIRDIQLSPTAFMDMQNLKLLQLYVPQEVHEKCKRQRRWTIEEKQPSLFSWLPVVKAWQCLLAKSRIWGSLRLLGSYGKECDYDYEVFKKYCKVQFPRGLQSLPEGLRYLYWDGYPWKSLPSKYFPENLVEIHMPHSQVERLWNSVQNLGNLKCLNLSYSKQLIVVPDLSRSRYIERIDLRRCSRVQVPSYFQSLENLTYLNLNGCENLKTFREIPCNLEFLDLSFTGIEELSPSIWSHEKLQTLNLSFCRKLKNLPSSTNSCQPNVYGTNQNRIGLKHLSLCCSAAVSIPECIYNLNHLEFLDLSNLSHRKRWPSSWSVVGGLSSLKTLRLRYCKVLEIPDNLICLSTLQELDLSGTMIKKIPASIKHVSGLLRLDLYKCQKLQSLPELPSQLKDLDARGCTSLKSVASSMQPCKQHQNLGHTCHFVRVRFTDCCELDETARNNIMGDAQLRCMQMASLKEAHSFHQVTVDCPGNEIPRWFRYEGEGCEINIQFPHDLHPTTTKKYSYLDFAASAVIANPECAIFPQDDPSIGFRLVCECSLKTNTDGEAYHYQFESTYIWGRVNNGFLLKEDHVVVFFERFVFRRKGNMSSDAIPLNKVTEASFRFYPKYYNDPENKVLGLIKVKKCGIHVL